MQGTLHLNLSSLVARQEHQSRRKKEMCTHMAASQFWYVIRLIYFRILHRYSLGIVGKGAVLVDFGRESSAFRKRKGYIAFSSYSGGMILAMFLLPNHQKVFDPKIDEAHLNLVQGCLSAVKSRLPIEKVLYLVLVQSSG